MMTTYLISVELLRVNNIREATFYEETKSMIVNGNKGECVKCLGGGKRSKGDLLLGFPTRQFDGLI